MEHGGTRCISKDVLKKLIEKSTPREWLQGQDSTKEYLLQFLVSYAICSVPKEDTKSALSDLATKRWKETRNLHDLEEDAEHYFACLLDVLTASDLAYVMWQYVNSYDDWCTKLQLLKDGKKVNMNKSNADWTSNHKIASMESRPDTDPGVVFYNSCLDWARGLMRMSKAVNGGPTTEYRALRIALNKRCMEVGLIRDPASATKKVTLAEVQLSSGGGDGGYVDAGGFVLDAEDVLPSHIVAFGV